MTGEEFYKWLHSKQEINACEVDFTLDPKNPLVVVLLDIRIVADVHLQGRIRNIGYTPLQ